MDMFRSERRKWRTPIDRAGLASHANLPSFDARSQELFGTALPRGVLLPRLTPDRERVNYWMSPHELAKRRFSYGQIILGKIANIALGHLDDRPIVTIAGARAGKTSTILEPNLYLYPGSMIVLDPKGELARTARLRRALGHNVYVLDPFGEASASFNPLAELDLRSPALVDDVISIANALVVTSGDARSKHWDDNARSLLLGLILLTLTFEKSERNLVTVRELLCFTYAPLARAAWSAEREALAAASRAGKKKYFSAQNVALNTLLNSLAKMGSKFGGIPAGIGKRYLSTPPNEMGSILSTAATHTDFLDSPPLRKTLLRSDFRLEELRSDRPTTIYLCLPFGRMERHARWLRLFVQLACIVLESKGTFPRTTPPILFLMEEFATLGHMPLMENAAAYFPGFGVKLWVVLQDVTQLQRHYGNGWETFLGNSGLVQLFANGDQETLRYAEGRLEKLIASSELRTAFARERSSQLLLMQGEAPAATLRLDHADVEGIRRHVEVLAFNKQLIDLR